jgi:hypothetical protein
MEVLLIPSHPMKPFYKILIAFGAVIVIGGGIYLAWWLSVEEPTTGILAPAGGFPAGSGTESSPTSTSSDVNVALTPRAISDHKVFDYWLVPETREIYYLTPEGYVYAVKEGPDLEISRQVIAALNSAEPSSDGRRLLAAFGNPAARQWALFDVADSVWRPLPREVINAGWGRTAAELIAMVTSGNDVNLSFVDITKTPPTYTVVIRDFRMEDTVLSALDSGDILIAERATARMNGRVWRLNPTAKTLTLAAVPAPGRSVKIARGENMSYLGSSEDFSLANGTLQNPFPLFFDTLPEKCGAVASTTYCFVPQNLADNVMLPDAYAMRDFYTIDGLFMINHRSLAIAPVPLFEGNYDADEVSVDENAIYFVDRYTKTLFSLARDGGR